MTTKKIANLHKMVSAFLRDFPDLRNDDIALQIALIRHKYPSAVRVSQVDGFEYVTIWALKRFTQDNVKRVRAKIQNEEGLYLPGDPAVRKARKIKEEEWEKWARSDIKPIVPHWSETDADD